jgi:hypothetical protein
LQRGIGVRRALVEEYRLNYERPNEALEPIVPGSSSKSARAGGGAAARARAAYARGPSRMYAIAIGVAGIVVVLLIVGLLSSDSSNNNNNNTPSTPARSTKRPHRSAGRAPTTPAGASDLVALSIQPTAPVYVCLISATGRKLIPGTILQPGTVQPTYHSHRFLLTLGNASVKLLIDGTPRAIPVSSQAIGYSITKAGGRHTLAAGELPTCR